MNRSSSAALNDASKNHGHVSDNTRRFLLRGRIVHPLLRHYQEHVFVVYCLLVFICYALRAIFYFVHQGYEEAFTSSFLMCFALATFLFPSARQNFEASNFVLNLTMMTAEILLVYLGFTYFPHFFLMLPMYLFATCLFSGMRYGTILGLISIGLSYAIFQFPMTLNFFERLPAFYNHYINKTIALLIFTQVLVAIVSILFYQLTGRSEDEIRTDRAKKAKATRKLELTETVGLMAHEINNPLAILDGARRMAAIYKKSEDKTNQRKCLLQMEEAGARLLTVIEQIEEFARSEDSEVDHNVHSSKRLEAKLRV